MPGKLEQYEKAFYYQFRTHHYYGMYRHIALICYGGYVRFPEKSIRIHHTPDLLNLIGLHADLLINISPDIGDGHNGAVIVARTFIIVDFGSSRRLPGVTNADGFMSQSGHFGKNSIPD